MTDDEQARLRQDEEIRHLADELTPQGIRVALAMLGNRAEAEEAAQDGIIRLVRKLGRYHRGGGFSSLYYKIVHNECLRRIRRRRPRGEPLDSTDEMGLQDEEGDPAMAVMREDERRIMQACLIRLPEKQREAVVLHFIEELPFAEVGQRLGMAENVASA